MKKWITALALPVLFAAAPAFADCAAVAEKAAAEQNGRLVKVMPAKDKNGRDICVVIVSVPGSAGEKPRRVELAVSPN